MQIYCEANKVEASGPLTCINAFQGCERHLSNVFTCSHACVNFASKLHTLFFLNRECHVIYISGPTKLDLFCVYHITSML